MLSVYCKRGTKVVSVQNWSFLVANFETLQKDSRTWNMFSSFFQCVCLWLSLCVFACSLSVYYCHSKLMMMFFFSRGNDVLTGYDRASQLCVFFHERYFFCSIFPATRPMNCSFVPFPKCVMICYEFSTSFCPPIFTAMILPWWWTSHYIQVGNTDFGLFLWVRERSCCEREETLSICVLERSLCVRFSLTILFVALRSFALMNERKRRVQSLVNFSG